MISILTKNTKEKKSDIELVLNSIRDIFPKEKVNICDNNSESLRYIPQLQESHFKKYRYANTKTNLLFSIHSIGQMVFEVIDKFPNEKDYWFINDKHLIKPSIDDINKSENRYIISLYSVTNNINLDVIRIPSDIAKDIKEIVEHEKFKCRQLYQVFNYGVFNDSHLESFLKAKTSHLYTMGINYYSDNKTNDYFQYLG